jgi:DNA-binding CsgD family transcriptional regulator
MGKRGPLPPDERIEKVKALTAQGWTAASIAVRLNTTARTVARDRVRAGIAQAPPRHLSAEDLQFAERLWDDGCPAREIARTLGCSGASIERHFRNHRPRNVTSLGARYYKLAEQLGLNAE